MNACCTLAAAVLLTIFAPAFARAGTDREAQLKAGYLLNFAKLAEWPASSPRAVITFCFLGGDNIRDALAVDLQKRSVGARPLVLRYLQAEQESVGCDLLYLDTKLGGNQHGPSSGQMHMLTISDAPAFLSHGGMIQLFTQDNRLRFRVNINNVKRGGLNLSSNLLQLAASVEREAPR
jgi:hypothetical protein